MKRQPTEWKKIFANDKAHKGLIFNSIKKQMNYSIFQMNNHTVRKGKTLKQVTFKYSVFLLSEKCKSKPQ